MNNHKLHKEHFVLVIVTEMQYVSVHLLLHQET